MSEKTVAKKRLAIQFYGYLRSFESCRDSFFENCVKPIEDAGFEVDIFMHTWDEVEYAYLSYDTEKGGGKAFSPAKTPSKKYLINIYHLAKIAITAQVKSVNDEKFVPMRCKTNYKYKSTANLYFSMSCVNSLRVKFEKENSVKYDAVLMMRADLFFDKKFLLDFFDAANAENKVFCYYGLFPNSSEMGGLDVFFLTHPKVANGVAKIYKNLSYENLQKANLWCPESVIYNFFVQNKIVIFCLNSWNDFSIAPFYIKRTKEFIEFRTPSQNDENKIIQINENELKKLRNLEHFSGFVKFYFHKRFRHLQVYSRRFRYPIKDFFRRIFKKTKR